MNVAVGVVSDTAITARSVIMRQRNNADTSLRLDVQRPVDSRTGLKGKISAKLATFITSHLSTPFSVSVPAPPLPQNSDLVQHVPTFAEHRPCPTCPHLCRTPILSKLSPPSQNSDLVQPGPTFAEHRPRPTCPHLRRTPTSSNLSAPLQNTDLIQPVPTFAEQRSCPICPHLCKTPILSNLSPPLQNSDLVQPGPTQPVDLRETLWGLAAESLACLRGLQTLLWQPV